jgi:hypothetical protein
MKAPNVNFQTSVTCQTGRCRTIGASPLLFLCCLMLGAACFSSRAAVVYETPHEFITSGDFDGDGRVDALVLDKLTGNARVGYQSPAGALVWSSPFTSGIENVTGVGIGKFVSPNRDSIAATAPDFNRIALLDVPIPGSNSLPVFILPGPSSSTNGLIAAWDFFDLPATTVSTATPATIPATVGAGTLDVSAFGLGSPQGSNPERTSFSGSTLNVFPGAVDGSPGTALALANSSANGKAVSFSFSMAGYRDLVVSFATRGTGTGFISGVWAWSTDGIHYVTLAGVNTASTNATFSTAVVSFSTETGLNNADTVYLRYTLSGATSASGNNRLDNLQLNATPVSAGGIGPQGLAGLSAPLGTNAAFDHLVCASSQNPTPAARLALIGLNAGTVVASSEYPETALLERVNPLPITGNLTFALGIVRGATNDALHVWQFTNSPGVIATVSNLAPGSDYAFGRFNAEPYPRLLFYVPGQSNVLVQALTNDGSGFSFAAATLNTFTSAVQRVFYVAEPTNGLVIIQFGDGTMSGLRLATGGGGQLFLSAGFAVTPAGNGITGVVPLGLGTFALLSSSSNSVASTFAQVFTQSGGNYTQTSSSALSAVTTAATRGNVWLFQLEPFASSAASLLGSLSAPAWSSTIVGLPGTLSVRVESDSGSTTGLNNPATNNLGAPPTGTAYALPNQYREDISFFGYGPARAPEPSVITISPPPGAYGGPIQVSFSKQNAADVVHFRPAPDVAWQTYATPFALTNDATVQFYGTTLGGTRGQIQFASYTMGNIAVTPEPLVTLPGSDTNLPPVVNPNVPQISAGGTAFYGRRGTNTVPSIWAINLDGSRETYLTTGREPRVSRDGRWMAFWRENDPATNQFSLWLRELPTGQESRWHTRSNRFVGCDWQMDNTHLIFAADGLFWQIGVSEPPVAFPLSSDTRQGAPAVNPVDGRVALQVIYPGSTGLYLAPSNLIVRQNLGLNILSPRWPAWSLDGGSLAVADDPNISPVLDAGRNLWVVQLGAQTNVFQITALTGSTNGFPNGAVWAPIGKKLVGAGRIGGVNGLWVIPLAADGSACHCPPILLPTSPGDDIDFAGSVLAPSSSVSYASLGLFIRLDPAVLVVYWSTNYDGFALESTPALPAGLLWSSVTGPYFRAGPYFEYRETRSALALQKYFRLHYPGVLVLTPPEPEMEFHVEPNAAVLNWPLNYVGYTLEATTNMSPPVLWTPLGGSYLNTNGVFEYRRILPGPPQEFYRLRGP